MAYVIPSLRKIQQPTTIVQSDFPSLSPISLSSGTPLTPKSPSIQFKKVILDRIERELLDDAIMARAPETDPQKMSVSSLEKAGWAVLYPKRIDCQRFNSSVKTNIWAPPSPTRLVSSAPVATAAVVQEKRVLDLEESDYEYESEESE